MRRGRDPGRGERRKTIRFEKEFTDDKEEDAMRSGNVGGRNF